MAKGGKRQEVCTREYTLTLGISTQLGRRTSGSVQVRRLHSTSGLNPYSENALVGNILHRF